MKVHDELGRTWLVLAGDPSWLLVKALGRGDIILPTETLARGIVPHPGRVEEQVHRLQTAWIATGDKDLKDAYIRAIILHDCLAALTPDVLE